MCSVWTSRFSLFIVLVGGLGSMRGVAIATVLLGAGPELIGFVTT
jgi:ABC-type branched-subunit amino acid transport system permease subunit